MIYNNVSLVESEVFLNDGSSRHGGPEFSAAQVSVLIEYPSTHMQMLLSAIGINNWCSLL